MSIFNDRLKMLRIESGKTQAVIAKDLGVTPQAFSFFVKGREPNYEILVKMAKYFDVTSDFLLGLSDTRKSENSKVSKDLGLTDISIEIIEEYKDDYRKNRCFNNYLHGMDYTIDDMDKLGVRVADKYQRNNYLLKKFFKLKEIDMPDSEIDDHNIYIFSERSELWQKPLFARFAKNQYMQYYQDICEKLGIKDDDIDYMKYKIGKQFEESLEALEYGYIIDPVLNDKLSEIYDVLFDDNIDSETAKELVKQKDELINNY